MERLKQDLVQLNKAIKTLNDALIHQQEVSTMDSQGIKLAAEDSIIKRFEYTYESFWKFLKKYLEKIKQEQDINSPRKVFYAAVEGDIFLDMIDDRNETSHTYNIEAARIIISDVPRYYSAMMVVVQRFNQEFQDH